MRTWSNYQTQIFDFVKNGEGNALVVAVAGSGKTTTIVEALNHARGQHIFLAFNKAIEVELKKRGVNARTFHSLCCSAVMRARGAKDINGDKVKNLAKHLFENQTHRKMYMSFCVKLVGLGKNAGIDCLVQNSTDEWMRLIQHHALSLDDQAANMVEAIVYAKRLLNLSNESAMIDFDDMLYFAVRDGLVLPKFDFIFVDEAQDTNSIQREILKKIMRPDSRMVAVGDPAQAIYGFRGADSDSLSMIGEQFNCTRLPLTVTYRCPKSVVALVNTQWGSEIESAPGAEEGTVERRDLDLQAFAAGDLTVCRTTKPLIKLGYSLLKAKKPFFIMGREIGQGLKALIRSFDPENMRDLKIKTEQWCSREVEKAMKKDDEAKAEAITDKADCILFLVDSMENASLFSLESFIDEMFASKDNATILATIHKSKGLEASRVWWLNSSDCPSKWAKQPWQKQQEVNLCYVAATRTKQALFFIEDKKEDFQ